MRAQGVMPAHALAQFPYRFRQIVDMGAFRSFPGVHTVQHAAQQIVVVLVAIGFEIGILRHFGEPHVADVLDVFIMNWSYLRHVIPAARTAASSARVAI